MMDPLVGGATGAAVGRGVGAGGGFRSSWPHTIAKTKTAPATASLKAQRRLCARELVPAAGARVSRRARDRLATTRRGAGGLGYLF